METGLDLYFVQKMIEVKLSRLCAYITKMSNTGTEKDNKTDP